jgi:hypothetical protein
MEYQLKNLIRVLCFFAVLTCSGCAHATMHFYNAYPAQDIYGKYICNEWHVNAGALKDLTQSVEPLYGNGSALTIQYVLGSDDRVNAKPFLYNFLVTQCKAFMPASQP